MRVAFLLAALAAAPALAQSVTYRPLAVGNEWTYLRNTNAPGSCSADTPRAYVRARVLRDTTSGGEAARLIRCDTFTPDGVFSQSATVAAPVAFGQATIVSGTDNTCRRIFSGQAPAPTTTIPNPVAIGTAEVAMNSVARSVFVFPRGATEDRYGDRVGRTSYSTSDTGSPSQNNCSAELISLVYAVVGGETFGSNPVAGEAEAPAAASALRAYPSPARHTVTVEAAERGPVEVFDLLGRRVATGEAAPGAPLRLDVRAWPAGVYVVRGAAAQAARFVVAR